MSKFLLNIMRELDQKSTILSIDYQIDKAVEQLKKSELVAFPTETVYGLGADASNEAAVAKVFAAKQRPIDHPLIVHLPDIELLSDWAINVPVNVRNFAKQFWPGPLTLILQKHPKVSRVVTGGRDSIAIRIPSHPIALALLKKMGSGLVGPSANTFGRISPTTAQHVKDDLGDKLAMVLDGGDCGIGIESTIVDFTVHQPQVVRQGMLDPRHLAKFLGEPIEISSKVNSCPGSHSSHYSPSSPTYLVASNKIIKIKENLQQQGKKVATLNLIDDPNAYAHQLYAKLHAYDNNFDVILVEQPPQQPAWSAIYDRLSRAAFQYVDNISTGLD